MPVGLSRSFLAGLLCLIFGAPVLAADPNWSDAEIDRRLRFLEGRLDEHATHGQIWYWSWLGVNAGSTVVNGTLAGLAEDTDDRVAYGSQAVLGALGTADLLFRPLNARLGADPIRSLPEDTREQKLAKLGAAEELLRGNAARAEQRTSIWPHLANALLNGGAGALTAALGNTSDGIINGATGFLGGEILIWTQPGGPADDWQDYQNLGKGTASLGVSVTALPDGAGLALHLKW